MANFLSDSDFPVLTEEQIRKMAEKYSYDQEMIKAEHSWQKDLINYLILTHQSELLSAKKMTENDILANRYFYLKKFYANINAPEVMMPESKIR